MLLLRRWGGWSFYSVQWLVQGLACVSVAWVLAQCFWWLAAPGKVSVIAKGFPGLSEQSQRVVVRHFFDKISVSRFADAAEELDSPRITDVHWQLLGTYVDPRRRNLAILVTEGDSEVLVVGVGTRLSSGHEVVEVRPDSVLLSKGAVRDELVLRPQAGLLQGQELPDERFEKK